MMSKYTALIHIDEKQRDIFCCVYLKHLLEKEGFNVTLVNRRSLQYFLQNVCFDIIIVPGHFFFESIEQEERIAKKSLIYILPTEAAFNDASLTIHKYTGYRSGEEKRRRTVPLAKKYFLWGQSNLRILNQTDYFSKEQLVITGSPRIQFLRKLADEKINHALPVGFVGRLSGFNPYGPEGESKFHLLNSFRSDTKGYIFDEDREVEDVMWFHYATARLTMEFLEECQRRNIKVKYRPHPRENLKEYDYIKRKFKDIIDFSGLDMPFELWVKDVSCVVSFNSTTFYESLLIKMPTITLTPLMGERLKDHVRMDNYHYKIREYVYNPKTMNDVFSAIEKVRDGSFEDLYPVDFQAIHEEIHDFYNTKEPGFCLEKVVQEIVSDLKNKPKLSFVGYIGFLIKRKCVEIFVWLKNIFIFYILRKKTYGASFFLHPWREIRKFDHIVKEYAKYFESKKVRTAGEYKEAAVQK